MNNDKFRELLKNKKIYKKETSTNFICICPYCGDHGDDRKKGHLYVSKDPKMPAVHCFIGGCKTNIPKFIFDITGNRSSSEEIISSEEFKNSLKKKELVNVSSRESEYNIPDIDIDRFRLKHNYISNRISGFDKSIYNYDNIIFDFVSFFESNKLYTKMVDDIGPIGIEYLQNKYIGFLSRNHSRIFCRNIDDRSKYRFRKLRLQERQYDLLDYVFYRTGNDSSNILVVGEGNFDILGEFCSDRLNLKNKVRLFAAGQSFSSYESLVKSVCYDEGLFNCDIYVLSDTDKQPWKYFRMFKNSRHVINDFRLYYNTIDEDFGSRKVVAVRAELPWAKYFR